jgi:hypothetical protein
MIVSPSSRAKASSLAAVGVLSGDDVQAWRMRVPQLVIAWALPLTAVLLVVATWDDPLEDESVQDVIALETMAGYGLFVIFLLTTTLGWLRPRLGLWVLTGCLLVLAPSTTEAHEFAIELFWLGLLVTDLLLAKRQRALARDMPRHEHRSLTPEPFLSLERRDPWVSWVLSGVSLALALGVLGLWVSARDTLADLDARAVSRDAEVTSRDTVLDFIDFRIDGKDYETQVTNAAEFEVGQTITVRVDPTGRFDPLGPEDNDPQWLSFWGPLCVPLIVLAVLLWVGPRIRHRDTKRAAADPRPVRAMVTRTRAGGIELRSADGLPFAFCRRVTPYHELARFDIHHLAPDSLHEARVYGLTSFGRTALVEIPDLGILLVPQTPLRDPFTTRALLRTMLGRRRLG